MSTPPDDSIGVGEELTPDDERWRAASVKLTDADTLDRISANARATVTTVTLVGTLITGLGLVSTQTLLNDDLARVLGYVAVIAAVLSVLTALLYLAARVEQVNPRDLLAVEAWYATRFRRARLAIVASWLLVVAVAFGASAGVMAIAGAGDDPLLSVTLTSEEARRLDVRVEAQGIEAGSAVDVRLVGLATSGCPEAVVLRNRQLIDRTGKLAMAATVDPAPCNLAYRLEVVRDGVVAWQLTGP